MGSKSIQTDETANAAFTDSDNLFLYGEDGLTLKVLQHRLSELFERLDEERPKNLQIWYRPSFGRGGNGSFGEFDFVITTPDKIFLGESKWDNATIRKRSGKIKLSETQLNRHARMQKYLENFKHPAPTFEEFQKWLEKIHREEFSNQIHPPPGSLIERNLYFFLVQTRKICVTNEIQNLLLYHHLQENIPLFPPDGFKLISFSYPIIKIGRRGRMVCDWDRPRKWGCSLVAKTATLQLGGHVRVPAGVHRQPDGLIPQAPTEGTIVRLPKVASEPVRVRLIDGATVDLAMDDCVSNGDAEPIEEWLMLRCVVGSRAYGLATEHSDWDERGVYLAPAPWYRSLYGAPEQLEDQQAQVCYWELGKFLRLALKANPTALECLYTPLVEHASPLGKELIAMRQGFLSKLAHQTYGGYVQSQLHKLKTRLASKDTYRPKHAMHLIRVLLCGITLLKEQRLLMELEPHRDRLLAIGTGEIDLEGVLAWHATLMEEFEEAFAVTTLPDAPNIDAANTFLLKAKAQAEVRS